MERRRLKNEDCLPPPPPMIFHIFSSTSMKILDYVCSTLCVVDTSQNNNRKNMLVVYAENTQTQKCIKLGE